MESPRSVCESGGDVNKEEPRGVGAQVTAINPDTGGEQRLRRPRVTTIAELRAANKGTEVRRRL
eukprot:11959365-Prorocentrum_lima.AAC.1